MKGDVEPLLKLRESTTGLYTRQFENAAKQLNEIIESQKKALGAFDKAMIEASDSFTKPYFEAIKELSSFSSQNLINSIWDKNSILLKDTFEKLQQQEKIRKQIKLIGSSGWTAIPDTYFESYLQAGKEKEQIDEFFYSLLTDDVISKLFEELLDKTDQKTDVEEAIIDYKGCHYKSCSLLLFSLIDGILISSQSSKSEQEETNLLTGKGAANKISTYLKTSLPANFHFYHFTGLTSCLLTVFDFANDFRIDETIINRNFVSHGMIKRQVNRTDCLQLFLLYRNLISFILDINKKFGNIKDSECKENFMG